MLEDNVRGLQHLGLPVTDIARSRQFYGQIGFKVIMDITLPEEDGPLQVAMLELHGLVLELYQLPGAALDEIRARSDGHIDHVSLDVLDVNRAFDDVRAMGLEPLEESPVFLPFWDKGVRYFNVRGPDGERVEFNERVR
jgi:catechol 2,3-dioxygenase-like lactoylglutathione lyase family enzyme